MASRSVPLRNLYVAGGRIAVTQIDRDSLKLNNPHVFGGWCDKHAHQNSELKTTCGRHIFHQPVSLGWLIFAASAYLGASPFQWHNEWAASAGLGMASRCSDAP
jgi:hypothetical protein